MVTEAKVGHCPWSAQTLPCDQANCGDCEVRKEAEAAENQRTGENMQDYWNHQRSEAEDWKG